MAELLLLFTVRNAYNCACVTGLGVTGVFIAPALTDLVVVVMAIFMVASEFKGMTKLAAQEK